MEGVEFDWTLLEKKEIDPPFIPTASFSSLNPKDKDLAPGDKHRGHKYTKKDDTTWMEEHMSEMNDLNEEFGNFDFKNPANGSTVEDAEEGVSIPEPSANEVEDGNDQVDSGSAEASEVAQTGEAAPPRVVSISDGSGIKKHVALPMAAISPTATAKKEATSATDEGQANANAASAETAAGAEQTADATAAATS